jgi:cob(I)alamin adenosyltransferase
MAFSKQEREESIARLQEIQEYLLNLSDRLAKESKYKDDDYYYDSQTAANLAKQISYLQEMLKARFS